MSLFNVGFVIFPELTQLDFTGPQQVLARLPQSAMHIIAKSAAPVRSDSGLSLIPTHTFENCPQLDLICIPGGSSGVVRAMGDHETIDFVQRQSSAAKHVTSVCTGAFVLGAAGLLKGRRATTHWAFTELLPLFGATHEKARIVKDGNVITAGGVTSGIDFGLRVAAEIAGLRPRERCWVTDMGATASHSGLSRPSARFQLKKSRVCISASRHRFRRCRCVSRGVAACRWTRQRYTRSAPDIRPRLLRRLHHRSGWIPD
jgi:cyclohexyl-isocyanide hydratase